MRGTTTITRMMLLLLSLSYQVCSVDGQDASVTKDTVTVGVPTPDISATSSSGAGNGPPTTSGKNDVVTQPTTTVLAPVAPTTPAAPAKPAAPAAPQDITTAKSNNPAPTQPSQPPPAVVTNNAPASTTSNSATVPVGGNAATAPTKPITDSSVSSITKATDAPVTTPPSANVITTDPSNLVTATYNPSGPTAAPNPGQPSTGGDITVTNQGGSNVGTGVTITVPSIVQTTPKAQEPTRLGATGATSTQNRVETTAAATNNPNNPTATSHHHTGVITTQPTFAAKTNPPPAITTIVTTTITIAPTKTQTFMFSLNNGQEKEEEKELAELCKRLMANLANGNCTLTWRHHNGKVVFDCVEINGKVKTSLATQYYEEITKKPTDNKTLIAILASCGALLIMIVILAVCASHHRKPYNENQQHLTEELHTVENGYHDNPTLEVMEVQPEMQEKKMALNGEFNDSWIVPIDNLLKEDPPEEEDTHL